MQDASEPRYEVLTKRFLEYARTFIENIDILLEFGLTTLASQETFRGFMYHAHALSYNLFPSEIDELIQRWTEMFTRILA